MFGIDPPLLSDYLLGSLSYQKGWQTHGPVFKILVITRTQQTILSIAVFTSKVSSIGAVTNTKVKGLSRGKFAAVNFYLGYLQVI